MTKSRLSSNWQILSAKPNSRRTISPTAPISKPPVTRTIGWGLCWPAYHTSFRRDLTNHIRQISLLPQLTSRSLSFTLRSGLPCSLSVNRPPPPAKGHTRSRFCPTQTRGLQSRSRRPRLAANYPTYTLRASVRHPQINPNPA